MAWSNGTFSFLHFQLKRVSQEMFVCVSVCVLFVWLLTDVLIRAIRAYRTASPRGKQPGFHKKVWRCKALPQQMCHLFIPSIARPTCDTRRCNDHTLHIVQHSSLCLWNIINTHKSVFAFFSLNTVLNEFQLHQRKRFCACLWSCQVVWCICKWASSSHAVCGNVIKRHSTHTHNTPHIHKNKLNAIDARCRLTCNQRALLRVFFLLLCCRCG